MNDNENNIENPDPGLQALVEYYRNKSNKIEHEFLLYQIRADAAIKQLTRQIQELESAPKPKPAKTE
jgi:hypothetical protein